MQQIADWLEKLGMSDYAQRFVENDIDLSILPDLTDQDLRELGLSMGHRRRLLRAISELNNTRPSSSDIAKSAPPPISVSEPSLRGVATAVPIGEASASAGTSLSGSVISWIRQGSPQSWTLKSGGT
jgi:hypothetical protein